MSISISVSALGGMRRVKLVNTIVRLPDLHGRLMGCISPYSCWLIAFKVSMDMQKESSTDVSAISSIPSLDLPGGMAMSQCLIGVSRL